VESGHPTELDRPGSAFDRLWRAAPEPNVPSVVDA
jgi:hypothetical protein